MSYRLAIARERLYRRADHIAVSLRSFAVLTVLSLMIFCGLIGWACYLLHVPLTGILVGYFITYISLLFALNTFIMNDARHDPKRLENLYQQQRRARLLNQYPGLLTTPPSLIDLVYAPEHNDRA